MDNIKLVYQCKINDIDNTLNKETVLIDMDKAEIQGLKKVIDERKETHESWRAHDDAKQRILIWGRLKLNIDVHMYGFSDYDIRKVKNALNGCQKCQAEIETDALLYSGHRFSLSNNNILIISDYEVTLQKMLATKNKPEQLIRLKERLINHNA